MVEGRRHPEWTRAALYQRGALWRAHADALKEAGVVEVAEFDRRATEAFERCALDIAIADPSSPWTRRSTEALIAAGALAPMPELFARPEHVPDGVGEVHAPFFEGDEEFYRSERSRYQRRMPRGR